MLCLEQITLCSELPRKVDLRIFFFTLFTSEKKAAKQSSTENWCFYDRL